VERDWAPPPPIRARFDALEAGWDAQLRALPPAADRSAFSAAAVRAYLATLNDPPSFAPT
jgi:hypothetical protein